MEASLTIIFGFMVFMIILNKGHLFFFGITSMLITAAISLGVGYGIALFVISIGIPLLKILGVVLTIIIVGFLLGKGGQ